MDDVGGAAVTDEGGKKKRVSGPGGRRRLFTQLKNGGPPAHREAVKVARRKVEILERQNRAWELFVAGATFKQIGEACQVSAKTAWYDCKAVLERLEAEQALNAVTLITRQQARLDALHRAHFPKRDESDSAQILLAISRREAQLHGLDKKRDDVVPVEQVLSFVKNITATFMEIVVDAEMRRKFLMGLRQQMGPLATLTGEVVKDGGRGKSAAAISVSDTAVGHTGAVTLDTGAADPGADGLRNADAGDQDRVGGNEPGDGRDAGAEGLGRATALDPSDQFARRTAGLSQSIPEVAEVPPPPVAPRPRPEVTLELELE